MAAADKLMGGDLHRGEARCQDVPEQEREACVDAFLAQRQKERAEAVAKNARALALLSQLAEPSCVAADPASHDECVAAAIEQRLGELPCPASPADASFECQVRTILERYGP